MDLKKLMQKPLVAKDDMPGDMSQEAVEIVTASVDKFLASENYEKAAQACKEALDKKFGPQWHCVVGEGFAFDISYNARNMLLVYYGEKLGVLIFKV